MIMNIPGVGSQYLIGFTDSDGNAYDGAKTYQGDAAQGHSGSRVLVVDSVRQPNPLDAANPAKVSSRRQPDLSFACAR